jgi:threonyl-tRNA synthetase
MEAGAVAVRRQGEGDKGSVSLEAFVELFKEALAKEEE